MGALHVSWKAPVCSWDGKGREKISIDPIGVEEPSHPTQGGFLFIDLGDTKSITRGGALFKFPRSKFNQFWNILLRRRKNEVKKICTINDRVCFGVERMRTNTC